MANGRVFLSRGIYHAYIKKHFCPDCNTKMERHYITTTVNSRSPEARKYDFSLLRRRGDVKFTIIHFVCPECGLDKCEYDGKIVRKGDENKKIEWL